MKIKEILNESIEDKGKFKAMFVAGLPGAGKSTITDRLIADIERASQVGARLVDPDKYTEFLVDPERRGSRAYQIDLSRPQEVPQWFLDKVKGMQASQLVSFTNAMLPMFLVGTGKDYNRIVKRSHIMESVGYETAMLWVGTDVDTAKINAMRRFQLNGRYVPIEYIEQSVGPIVDSFDAWQREFGHRNFFYIENEFISDDEMQEYQELIGKKADGIELEINEQYLLDELGEKIDRSIEAEKDYSVLLNDVNDFFNRPVSGMGKVYLQRLEERGEKFLTPGIYRLETLRQIFKNW